MEVKDFERYLELVKINEEYINIWRETRSDENYDNVSKTNNELRDFKNNLLKFVFKNQSSVATIVDKLKFRLDYFREYPSSDENKSFNEIKMVKEILNLLEMYDWKLMYSNYGTTDNEGNWIKQVSVWEQNGEGLVRKHKVWNVVDALDVVGKQTKDTGRKVSETLKGVSEDLNKKGDELNVKKEK